MQYLPQNIASGIATLIQAAQLIGISFAVMAVIYSAVRMVMAEGPLEARQERKALLEALVALVLIATAVPVANWILSAFGTGLQVPRGKSKCRSQTLCPCSHFFLAPSRA